MQKALTLSIIKCHLTLLAMTMLVPMLWLMLVLVIIADFVIIIITMVVLGLVSMLLVMLVMMTSQRAPGTRQANKDLF